MATCTAMQGSIGMPGVSWQPGSLQRGPGDSHTRLLLPCSLHHWSSRRSTTLALDHEPPFPDPLTPYLPPPQPLLYTHPHPHHHTPTHTSQDPGNWATDIAGGARFGYTLLCVILMSSAAAMVLQYLSLKLGVAADRDLAQACRDAYPRPVCWTLWVLAEVGRAAVWRGDKGGGGGQQEGRGSWRRAAVQGQAKKVGCQKGRPSTTHGWLLVVSLLHTTRPAPCLLLTLPLLALLV